MAACQQSTGCGPVPLVGVRGHAHTHTHTHTHARTHTDTHTYTHTHALHTHTLFQSVCWLTMISPWGMAIQQRFSPLLCLLFILFVDMQPNKYDIRYDIPSSPRTIRQHAKSPLSFLNAYGLLLIENYFCAHTSPTQQAEKA